MKSKKRHHDSSEESEDSEVSEKSSSSSESESDDSSVSDHRHKKKKKHSISSKSESESDRARRSKKRKHKKKKKKHSKKKRRSESLELESAGNISISEGEISSKKRRKHKHKHSKRTHDSEESEERSEHRLHSVVKERHVSPEEHQPSRTYYHKEYHQSGSHEYERVAEVERFYRGSSKDRRAQQQENYYRERTDRYVAQQDKYDRNKDKYGQGIQYDIYNRGPKEYDQYKRNPRYEQPKVDMAYRKPDEPYYPRDDSKGYMKNNQYATRGPKRREFGDEREYRERPPEPDRYRDREYPDKRERYRVEEVPERAREYRREKFDRVEKLIPPPRQYSKSPEDRYKEKKHVESRDRERYREVRRERDDADQERDRRSREPRPERNDKVKDRASRFTDADEKKEYNWGKTEVKKEGATDSGEKEKPNFGLSGKLTADANTVNGVVLKYAEPDDAKQPKRRWRFYPFKGDKAMPILYIHRQSCFLIGRDKKVVDIPLDHPSISKQHSVLQYRATPFTRPDGTTGRRVRPYIIDLDSANGTFVNNKKIEARRYVELLERDVVKFGFSQREYVLLHENSKDDAQDDDQDAPVVTTDKIKQEKRAKEEAAADG
ncbi:smad nuclear-interacting protein 1 isoform X2 [Leptidea sinapis]|uniref:smad nuclear-interacting protein 1 isoform X2 n=1 Tax=Leptidea sinapis TaxID=189913 RepID=UPI0021C36B03|nr:smad nuclear-interacting protein 1 isoform X2 [Leptidea sinapis]